MDAADHILWLQLDYLPTRPLWAGEIVLIMLILPTLSSSLISMEICCPFGRRTVRHVSRHFAPAVLFAILSHRKVDKDGLRHPWAVLITSYAVTTRGLVPDVRVGWSQSRVAICVWPIADGVHGYSGNPGRHPSFTAAATLGFSCSPMASSCRRSWRSSIVTADAGWLAVSTAGTHTKRCSVIASALTCTRGDWLDALRYSLPANARTASSADQLICLRHTQQPPGWPCRGDRC